MKIVTKRDALLPALLQIGNVVERRQTLPILTNLLASTRGGQLALTATDLEVELKTLCDCTYDTEGSFTLPARKMLDITRALPDGAEITIETSSEKARVLSGKSRFTLGVLPAQDYPALEPAIISERFSLPQKVLARLIEKTQFAMAQQDVRYYLNGLLLELKGGNVQAVATDGHRLALAEARGQIDGELGQQVILPRKAVLELGRLLTDDEEATAEVELSSSHVRVMLGSSVFTTKLIDGRFPDYQRVIPTGSDKCARIARDVFRQALVRAAILSNEKYRGIRLRFAGASLHLQANNPEQEEAEEELEIIYGGPEQVVGFNAGYLLDALNVIEEQQVELSFRDANNSVLVTGVGDESNRYVIMPMRL